MLVLHSVASTYGKRPSEIVGIKDEWAAYQFDLSVLLTYAEDQEQRREEEKNPKKGKGKSKAKDSGLKPSAPQEFGDLSSRATKSVKIPENGVW